MRRVKQTNSTFVQNVQLHAVVLLAVHIKCEPDLRPLEDGNLLPLDQSERPGTMSMLALLVVPTWYIA